MSLQLHTSHNTKRDRREAGAALLIAIFALLLISVVAIALMVSSGTDSALQSNYRTSTESYYAALAGVEEARGRIFSKNPDCLVIRTTLPNCPIPPPANFVPTAGSLPAMGLTDVRYILNPANGETVDPQSANPANYPDTEYQTEFGWALSSANVQTTNSVSSVAGLPGPLYKWARITPATELSLNIDVDSNGTKNPSARLFYEPANLNASCLPSPGPMPEGTNLPARCGLPPSTSPTASAVEVLEITSLAALPNGTRRILQYVVTPSVVSFYSSNGTNNTVQFAIPPGNNQPSFPAALTILGNNPTFSVSAVPGYPIDGRDACSGTTPQAAVNSIGYTDPAAYTALFSQINPNKNEYPGYPLTVTGPPPGTYTPAVPSLPNPPPYVSYVPQSWQVPSSLNALAQDITNSADVVITGPANSSSILSGVPAMSPTNPMTIVVNGDLNLNSGTGYGLLLVTGTLTYQPLASWNGIILVIGRGAFVYNSGGGGSGGIQGAVLLATTRDGAGNLLGGTVLGSASFTSYGSNSSLGIIYNSCWVQTARGPLGYKILSFREIPLTN